MFVVDAGDFAWKSRVVRTDRLDQQRRKGELILAAFAKSGIDAVVPGEGDLALGVDWLTRAADQAGVPLVAANLTCDGEKPFAGGRRVEREGVAIGFVGVLSPALAPEGCTASEPARAVQAEIAALGAQGRLDMVVVLAHEDPEDDRALAQAVTDVDVVVNGHGKLMTSKPRALPHQALELGAGSRGRRVGIARITLMPGGHGFESTEAAAEIAARLDRYRKRRWTAQKNLEATPAGEAGGRARRRVHRQIAFYDKTIAALEAELNAATEPHSGTTHRLENDGVTLDARVEDDPEVAAMVNRAKAEIDAMERQQARAAAGRGVPSSMGPFAGTASCTGCHPAQAKQWQTTPHAHAWASLGKVGRQMDQDCWRCHVTGAFHPDGPERPAEVGALVNVGCESCHGPGRAHVDRKGKVEMVARPTAQVCKQCHDGTRDQGRFVEADYMPAVRH